MKKLRVRKERADNMMAVAERHARLGELKQAADICRASLSRNPNDVTALFLLGAVMIMGKEYTEGEIFLRKAHAIDPSHIGVLNNLGVLYRDYHKNLKAAAEMFTKVISLNPAHIHALINLGNIYCDLNQHAQGEKYFQRALAINPNDGMALGNLGLVCEARQEHDKAIEYYRKALQLVPENNGFVRNLILAVFNKGDKLEAVRLIDAILRLPDPDIALIPVYSIARRLCLWDVSDAVRERMLSLVFNRGVDVQGFEMMNMDLLADPAVSGSRVYEVHRMAGQAVEGQCMQTPFSMDDRTRAEGRLKIGYISGDMRRHVVSTFFADTFSCHDKERFEIYCYSSCNVEDEVTKRYQSIADHFVNVSGLSDVAVAERVHADGVHVLVNLAGYTKWGRMGVMAYRPAPVQIIYLGYPYTSGMASVDYILSDPFLSGPQSPAYFTEQQLCLPESFLAFGRLDDTAPESEPPFHRNGVVTFGSMNNAYKLNPQVIAAWSRALRRLPGSRMIINHPNCDLEITRQNILAEFVKNGVEEDRIEIIWQKHPAGSHLHYYNDIDIVLDAFPLTGGTTTIEAVWMGVPVVTLVGEVYHQRLSYSVLKNIGLNVDDLIAFNLDEYVEKAVALANNQARLDELHAQIPEKLAGSTLRNPERLARHLETAYIEAWNKKFPLSAVPTPSFH